MLNNRVVAASMVKHNDQSSKSNLELHICMIVYITVLEAVLFLRFTFTAGLQHARVRSMVSTSAFKHNDQTSQSQTSTCSSIASSGSPGSTLSSSFSCCLWLFQDCNLHMSVHASPFAMHVHFGSLQERTRLQANNSKTASGAGDDRIQWMTSLPPS